MVERGGRSAAAERAVLANVDPEPAGVGPSAGKDRHRRVVAMQALGRQDMRGDPVVQRVERRRAGADLAGERREAEVNPFPGVPLRLPMERLMLPELLEEDRREQVRSSPPARGGMER
jgi:hypothetical protein